MPRGGSKHLGLRQEDISYETKSLGKVAEAAELERRQTGV